MNKINFKEILLKIYLESNSGENSTRSPERLKLLHGYIKREIEENLNEKYSVFGKSMDGTSREYKFKGKINDKYVDVAIVSNETNEMQSAISIKFVWTNYEQNVVNYFEQMIAESYNISKSEKDSYQLIILRKNTPNFFKNKTKIKKIEKINNDKIKKRFSKLLSNSNIIKGICLIVVDFGDLNILEKHLRVANFKYEDYSLETITSIDINKIKLEYPLSEVKNSLTLEELLNKVKL